MQHLAPPTSQISVRPCCLLFVAIQPLWFSLSFSVPLGLYPSQTLCNCSSSFCMALRHLGLGSNVSPQKCLPQLPNFKQPLPLPHSIVFCIYFIFLIVFYLYLKLTCLFTQLLSVNSLTAGTLFAVLVAPFPASRMAPGIQKVLQ